MAINLSRKLISTFFAVLMFTMIFQNVAAAHTLFTIEDSNSSISLDSDDSFTVSLRQEGYRWKYELSNPSVLKMIDLDGYALDPENPGSPAIYNWTFEGLEKGTTTLTFIYWDSWSGDVAFTFVLNVTSNVSRTTNTLLIITIFSAIIVVPSVAIIKRMKGDVKNEK